MRIFNATITDANGNVQNGASITVRDESTSALITVYDIDDNVLGNPFLVGADGLCQFKILDDRFVYVLAEFGGDFQEWRFVPLFDYENRFDAVEDRSTVLETTTTEIQQRNPPGSVVPSFFARDPAVLGVRLINLVGQVVEIADYQEACDNLYCGDALNSTAEAFYKTSDSAGTVRSTAGAYMVFADPQGLGFKGIGDAVISGRTKTGPANVSEVQEDQGQRMTGSQRSINPAADSNPVGVFSLSNSISEDWFGNAGRTMNWLSSFNSADSPDYRYSTDTDGPTRDSTIGGYWSVTY